MTKKENMFNEFQAAKEEGAIDFVILYIHMPTGELETLINPNVEEKMKYIDRTYSDELVHANCKDIYIEQYIFCTESDYYDFGWALERMKEGCSVARNGWNGRNQYVRMVEPYTDPAFKLIENEKIDGTLMPFFAIKNAQNGFIPWVPSTGDLIADDWYVAYDPKANEAGKDAAEYTADPALMPATP